MMCHLYIHLCSSLKLDPCVLIKCLAAAISSSVMTHGCDSSFLVVFTLGTIHM